MLAELAATQTTPETRPQDLEAVAACHAPYHFTDRVGPEGLTFDYRLLPGPATTRNTIALLQLQGAPERLVASALERAAALDKLRGDA